MIKKEVNKLNYNNITREDIKTTIKLNKTLNTRHMGGYVGKDGKLTSKRAFIRSDVPSNITHEDINKLIHMNLRTVIDLRTQDEIESQPVPFSEMAEIDYVIIPLVSDDTPPHLMEVGDLGDLYIHILEERKAQIAEAFKMIKNTDGTVFFNCSAGKDRTGVLGMLILKLAGVIKEDLIKDYYFTEILLEPWIKNVLPKLEADGVKFDRKMLRAYPEYIEKAIDHIDNEYKSIEKYLESAGLSESDMTKLIKKTLVK